MDREVPTCGVCKPGQDIHREFSQGNGPKVAKPDSSNRHYDAE